MAWRMGQLWEELGERVRASAWTRSVTAGGESGGGEAVKDEARWEDEWA